MTRRRFATDLRRGDDDDEERARNALVALVHHYIQTKQRNRSTGEVYERFGLFVNVHL
jgi:hypothetical protein